MNKLKPAERDKAKQFLAFTNTNEKCAIELLEAHQWNLEVAVDSFFNNPPASAFEEQTLDVDPAKIEGLFKKYSDAEGETISDTGMQKFLEDAGVDSNDIVPLIIAWQLSAKTLGEFTKTEFMEGFTALKCDSMSKLKERIPSLQSEIAEEQAFKEFYSFMFDYSKAGT